jgi:hypothetical protein
MEGAWPTARWERSHQVVGVFAVRSRPTRGRRRPLEVDSGAFKAHPLKGALGCPGARFWFCEEAGSHARHPLLRCPMGAWGLTFVSKSTQFPKRRARRNRNAYLNPVCVHQG